MLLEVPRDRRLSLMLTDILLLLSVLYALQILTFTIAALNARYSGNRDFRPAVSVIVAARNEEENIGRCLDSMVRLTYPADLLEVLIVDDRSTDRTRSIALEYADRHPHIRVIVVEQGSGQLRGKTNAVAQGIEASRGEILLFTDADCVVPPGWVEETVKYYDSSEVGLVAGFTALQARNWFGFMQTVDWFCLFSVAAATVRLHFPVTAVGNNLSVRRTAYDMTGGFAKIPFSVTEDYALFHAVTATTPFRARFPLDPSTLVTSIACSSFRQLHHQKKRWFTGGKGMHPKYLAILSASYLLNALMLIVAIVEGPAGIWPAILLKVAADFALMLPSLSAFRRWDLLRYFPIFEVYFFLYVLLYPPLVLLAGEVKWKDRKY